MKCILQLFNHHNYLQLMPLKKEIDICTSEGRLQIIFFSNLFYKYEDQFLTLYNLTSLKSFSMWYTSFIIMEKNVGHHLSLIKKV